jgi:hypothetical protein
LAPIPATCPPFFLSIRNTVTFTQKEGSHLRPTDLCTTQL